jgi:short-subunit dehydrogenase
MNKQIAVITGATSGLGMAYAKLLAQSGADLLITGRRKERLFSLKKELEDKYAIRVKIVVADFNHPQEFDGLLSAIDKLEVVSLLINNAGYGCRDSFFEKNYKEQENMLQVHITAATRIIHTVVPKMVRNNGGQIINVASLSAFLPDPFNYFYNSTKAFLVSFSESLYIDLCRSHINVQALCPGFIKTEFHSRIGQSNAVGGWKEKFLWMNPDEVAAISIKSLSRNQVICVPGLVNKVIYHLIKILPKRVIYWLIVRNIKYFDHPLKCAA